MKNHRYRGDADGWCEVCGAEQHEHVGHGKRLTPVVVTAPATSRDDQVATYNEALRMLADFADLEPTSAFKAAAHAAGVPWGEEMGRFVTWARARYLKEQA